MAVQIPGTIPRILEDGQTGSQRASGFARVRLEGAKDLVQELVASRPDSAKTPRTL
jgi:hypothetical protein